MPNDSKHPGLLGEPETGKVTWWDPLSWWDSWFGNVSNWLGGLGGDIGSGIEAGVVTVLKDIWAVVLPYIEIGLGMAIVFWGIAIWIMSTSAGQAAVGTALKAAVL